MKKFKFISKELLFRLPKNPGVYAFSAGKKKEILYIGKAADIRERAKNHFQSASAKSSAGQTASKDNFFIPQTALIGYIETASEIEALILEANLIKKYRPKYNVIWKDDKNYFYVATTKEAFPQIFITHQISKIPNKSKIQISNYAGPFVEGRPLKETLKFLRKIFPFRSCRILPKRSCLWHHLDRCPAPCVLNSGIMEVPKIKGILENDAKKNTGSVMRILEGKKTKVLSELKKDMKAEAIAQNFERAAKIRNRISSLERVLANARIFEKQTVFEEWNKTQKIIQNITGAQNEISKIEAYDISNIQGQTAAGSMVVFINGAPDKSQYRKFKIRGKFTPYRPESGRRTGAGPDDISMLKEVLQRRFGHPEWRFPDLILIDGGRAQLNAALSARGKLKFLAASLAKKKNELYIESRRKPLLLLSLPRPIYNLILQLRDEAHRFAISYHRKLRKKNVFV